jgi:hypothetical protein
MGKKDKKNDDRSLEAWAGVIMKATLICENCGEVHRIANLTEKWYTCTACGQEMRGREKTDKEVEEITHFEQPAVSAPVAKVTSEVTVSHGATKIAYSHYEKHLSSIKAGKVNRKQLIAEVVGMGIHKGTASVQWCKFAKANNI